SLVSHSRCAAAPHAFPTRRSSDLARFLDTAADRSHRRLRRRHPEVIGADPVPADDACIHLGFQESESLTNPAIELLMIGRSRAGVVLLFSEEILRIMKKVHIDFLQLHPIQGQLDLSL